MVSVAPVVLKKVSPLNEFNGRIEAVGSVELRTRVSGYIDSVNFADGQEVAKGDLLFTIDDRSYRAELARATAELARARTLAALASDEAARAQVLVEQQAISTEIWQQRRAASERTRSEVAVAEAAVELARLNVDWTRVRAPIAGRTGRALVTPGNLVTAGQGSGMLTSLIKLDTVHVFFDVDELTFRRFTGAGLGRRPQAVRVGLAGESGHPHLGRLDFLDNQVMRQTGTMTMRAVLDNKGRQFTPGLFARVLLPVSEAFDALLIDDKAVLTDQDRKFAYVIDQEGKAQRRNLQLGGMADGLRIVQSGLAPGERVVVEGVRRINRPGTAVSAQAVAMVAKEAPAARAAQMELAR